MDRGCGCCASANANAKKSGGVERFVDDALVETQSCSYYIGSTGVNEIT